MPHGCVIVPAVVVAKCASGDAPVMHPRVRADGLATLWREFALMGITRGSCEMVDGAAEKAALSSRGALRRPLYAHFLA